MTVCNLLSCVHVCLSSPPFRCKHLDHQQHSSMVMDLAATRLLSLVGPTLIPVVRPESEVRCAAHVVWHTIFCKQWVIIAACLLCPPTAVLPAVYFQGSATAPALSKTAGSTPRHHYKC